MIDTNVWYSESLVSKVITPKTNIYRSRYDLKEQLLLKDNNLVIRNMRKSDLTPIRNSSNIEYRVEAKDAYRPDLIAYNMYGDPRYAWIILSANNLSDIFDLKAGLIITIPSMISLYASGGVLAR